MAARLRHPFCLLLCGPSFSDKTEFVIKLIQPWIIGQHIDDIVICYSEWQNAYETLRDRCRFVGGMLDPDDLDETVPHLVITDDLQDTQDERIKGFFVKYISPSQYQLHIHLSELIWSGAKTSNMLFECKLYCPTRFSTRSSTDNDTRTADVP